MVVSNETYSGIIYDNNLTYTSVDQHTLHVNTTTTAVIETNERHKAFYETAKEVTGLYMFPLVCVIGIIGNILTCMVFVKFKARSSTNVYLTALAISDTIKLLCDFLYFIVVFLDKINEPDKSMAVFSTMYPYAHYLFNFSLCNTAWLTVSVAVERFIYMKWPERASILCTTTRAKITCCVVWISAMLITIPFALRYHQLPTNGTTEVIVTPLWNIEKFRYSYVWFQNILRSIIPLVVLTIINIWIVVVLSRMNNENYEKRPLACKTRVTVMLVAMILAYLICITPDAIISAALGFGYTEAPYLIRGIREISDLLLCINSALNFYLYFGFNKVFRHNFARIFCKNYYWERLGDKDEGVT